MIQKLLLGIPKKLLYCNIVLSVVWGIMYAYMSSALAQVTATKIEEKAFLQAAIFFVVFILLWEFIEFACDYMDLIGHAYVRNGTYQYYLKKLYSTEPESLQNNNSGYVAGILTQLIERKITVLFDLVMTTISVIYVVYLILYIGKYSLWFSLIVFLLTGLGIMIWLLCSKLIANDLKNMTVVKGEQTRIFLDSINNIATVQKLRGLSFIQKKVAIFDEKNINATSRYVIGNEIGFCLYKTINYLLCPICMFVALALYEKNTSFPIVEFMAYLSVITVQLVHNVKNIAGCIKNYNMFTTTQKEMDEIIKKQSDVYTSTSIGEHFNEICIRNIKYQYKAGTDAITIHIPKFYIKKGEKICIMGESGQGKTTLLKLLSGMIQTDGKLYVDNKEVRDNIDAVFIAQDTEMLDLSLRDNLTFGNEGITDEVLVQMLEQLGMKEWFEKQKDGLDTLLGERGVFVSTGQRQRLNILRGLLVQKEIYLLDEPTSNVDEETEEKMIHLIDTILKDKTVIIVTHKEKIQSICDRKYVFKNNVLACFNE